MMTARLTIAFSVLLLSACAEELPPHSVPEFMEDRILLEATMVRCGQDRATSRYDPNCVNAREAVDRIAAAEAAARREALEAESERKLEAVRRARDAADERRRLEEEAERRREEAAQFGNFEEVPDDEGASPEPSDEGDAENGGQAAPIDEQAAGETLEGAS